MTTPETRTHVPLGISESREFRPTWRAGLKMFARLFRIEQVVVEKSLAGAVYKHEKEETKAKSVLVDLKMPKLDQIFKTALIATKRLSFENIYLVILL